MPSRSLLCQQQNTQLQVLEVQSRNQKKRVPFKWGGVLSLVALKITVVHTSPNETNLRIRGWHDSRNMNPMIFFLWRENSGIYSSQQNLNYRCQIETQVSPIGPHSWKQVQKKAYDVCKITYSIYTYITSRIERHNIGIQCMYNMTYIYHPIRNTIKPVLFFSIHFLNPPVDKHKPWPLCVCDGLLHLGFINFLVFIGGSSWWWLLWAYSL